MPEMRQHIVDIFAGSLLDEYELVSFEEGLDSVMALVALARVNKNLSENALDALWRNLDNLYPFTRLLPASALTWTRFGVPSVVSASSYYYRVCRRLLTFSQGS